MSSLAIVSGGMDSISLIHCYRDRISHVLNFIYGSKHNARESVFAAANAAKLGMEFIQIDLAFIGEHFKSDLLQSGGNIPEGHYEDLSMRRTVVPFRNGIMLAIAIGLAESRGLKSVYIGNHAGDHTIYPDCRPAFIASFNDAAKSGTIFESTQSSEPEKIISPFMNLTKREIALEGRRNGVDFSMTYTCYKGGNKHCGKCGACTERREALDGFDPTSYENI